MDPFIEVIGQGTLTEKVVEYRMDLSVTVRAVQGDAALKEATELRNRCIRTLKESGIRGGELTEGGGQALFWKKKPGQEVSHKILIACPDRDRLFKALGALEPLFDNQRFSLIVSMRQPKFEAISNERSIAMSGAITDAKSSAGIIAHEASLRVTGVIQVEELDQRRERSGCVWRRKLAWRVCNSRCSSAFRGSARVDRCGGTANRTPISCSLLSGEDALTTRSGAPPALPSVRPKQCEPGLFNLLVRGRYVN
jgi:hypothetical protein